jgi:hypothetical protein
MRLRALIALSRLAVLGLLLSAGSAHAALPVQMAAYYLDGLDSQTLFIGAALVLPAFYLMASVVFRSVRHHFGARTQDKGFDPRVGIVLGILIAVLILVRLAASAAGMAMRHFG